MATLREAGKARNVYMGAAVADFLLSNATAKSLLATQYSSLTAENVMKWGQIHPQRDYFYWAKADALVNFAQTNGQKVHGHTLLWHTELPSWATAADVEKHIKTIVGRYKGRVHSWDVVNEVLSDDGVNLRNTFYGNVDMLVKAFKWAHEADPDAILYINDYNIEDARTKSNRMYSLVQELISKGAPVHGVGFQCHFHTGWTPASALAVNVKRFAALGLKIHISEFDCAIRDGASFERQGQLYGAMMDAALQAGDKLDKFTTWGFTDASTWLAEQNPLPFDTQYQAKPAVAAMLKSLGAAPTPTPEVPMPTVYFAQVKYGNTTANESTKTVQRSLNSQVGTRLLVDGLFGPATKSAYTKWQLKLWPGASTAAGGDADGLPAKTSMTRLSQAAKFTLIFPTTTTPTTPTTTPGRISAKEVKFTRFTGTFNVEATVRAACAANGFKYTTAWLNGYKTAMVRESGGDPNAANLWDSNAITPAGYSRVADYGNRGTFGPRINGALTPFQCSRGAWQCIPQTFAYYHAPGTSLSIYDPVASCAASMKYVTSRYGVATDGSNLASRVQQFDPNRSPKGY